MEVMPTQEAANHTVFLYYWVLIIAVTWPWKYATWRNAFPTLDTEVGLGSSRDARACQWECLYTIWQNPGDCHLWQCVLLTHAHVMSFLRQNESVRRSWENSSRQILFFMHSLCIQSHVSNLLNFRNVTLKSVLAELHWKDSRHEKGCKASVTVTQQQKTVSIALSRIKQVI